MSRYRIDFESKSECDIKKFGGWRYADDVSTSITLCAIARDDEPVLLWDVYASDEDNAPALELIRECSESDGEVWAFNAGGFEVPMSLAHWGRTFGCRRPEFERWRCSAVMARVASAPGKLEKAAEFFGLDIQKDKAGAVLIKLFCVPQKPRQPKNGPALPNYWIDPVKDADKIVTVAGEKISVGEAWQRFRNYCIRDVETERALGKKLTILEIKGDLLKAFIIDLKMNARGIPVNVPGVIEAEKIVNTYNAKLEKQFRALTGYGPNQNKLVLQWLQDRGYPAQNLQAATVADILDLDYDIDEEEESESAEDVPQGRGEMTEDAVEALQIRAMLSFAALKKFPTMRLAACRDGRVRGAIQFYGAHTGRASGRIIQIQNFKRPILGFKPNGEPEGHDVYRWICQGKATPELLEECFGASPLACIASSIRHWIDPGPGKEFLDIDLANIEARVLAWLAGYDSRIANFHKGEFDLYKTQAASMFAIDYAAVSKDQRQKAKVAELSLGYGGGKAAFVAMAKNYGLKMPVEQIKEIVKLYRKSNPEITGFWRTLQDAAGEAIAAPGKWFNAGRHIKFGCRNTLGYKELVMKLPSGRTLHYPQPEIHTVYKRKDFETEEWVNIPKHRAFDAAGDKLDGVWITRQITYYGQITDAVWGRVGIWGGTFAENAAQAVAADFLIHGTIELEEEGYETCFQVHDQSVSLYEPAKGQSPEEMRAIMCRLPVWADDFPLEAEAHITPFYSK